MILNGSEMISGDSIIMPIAISTLDTTRSMIRNGMKIMKPIWNAVFSSEVTKAGTSMVSGVASALAMSVRLDRRTNSSRSDCRVCASMNPFSGTSARLSASCAGICSLRYGCSASLLILSNTGAMTNRVRNSARPISTWFDGVVCRPSAWRRMEKTMMIRVKLVISMTNAGMKLSAVMISRICRLTEYSCWPCGLVVTVIAEIDIGSAAKACGRPSRRRPSASGAQRIRAHREKAEIIASGPCPCSAVPAGCGRSPGWPARHRAGAPAAASRAAG
ncbi:hypothetical protein D3C76_1122670 [compost metagenome]